MNNQIIVIKLLVNRNEMILVLIGLFLFGLGYNWLVTYLKGQHEGWTSWLVVGGVVVTGIGFSLLAGLGYGVVLLMCFVASGLPMIAGEFWRVIQIRRAALLEARKKAWQSQRDSDTTPDSA